MLHGSASDACARTQARAYQLRVAMTICTTESITGTSTSTPTTVASAAPDWKPNRLIAVATASSKKLTGADQRRRGRRRTVPRRSRRLSQIGQAGVEIDLDE